MEDMSKNLRNARLYQVFFIILVLVYAGAVVFVRYSGVLPQMLSNEAITRLTVILAFFGIANLSFGYLLPRWMVRLSKAVDAMKDNRGMLFGIQLAQGSSFEAIATYGLALGVLGADWETVLPFFIIALAALIHTFPTGDRWKKLANTLSGNGSGI